MIIAQLTEQNLPAGTREFNFTRAQLVSAGVTASETRLRVRCTRVGWPLGTVGDAEIDTAAGWGARYYGIEGGTPLRGSNDAVFQISVKDNLGNEVQVLNMAPISARVVLTQSVRTEITVEAV